LCCSSRYDHISRTTALTLACHTAADPLSEFSLAALTPAAAHARQHGGRQVASSSASSPTAERQRARSSLFKEIGRRVTADHQFGKDREPRAWSAARRVTATIFSRFPEKSPMVGLICASAILHTSLIQYRGRKLRSPAHTCASKARAEAGS